MLHLQFLSPGTSNIITRQCGRVVSVSNFQASGPRLNPTLATPGQILFCPCKTT